MPDPNMQLVDQLSPQLLRWARGKTGDREAAEDLVQEVWLQYFSAEAREIHAGRPVLQPEHLLWKVARYVWLRTLRQQTHHRTEPLSDGHPDPRDFAADLADVQERQRTAAWLRQRIINLDRLQREAMILFYIDGLPQREIARRLGVSETTLRWHLFETRRKLREGASTMHETTDFVYTPHQLGMGINGQDTPDNATHQVRNSLLMQNICCACYHEGRTAQELAEMLGVARPYIEHDLRWLIEQEFIMENRGRYFTTFIIMTSQQEMALYSVYEAHKATLCDAITHHLLAREEDIRLIGFIGSDRPMNKLLWLLIYRFCCHLPLISETPEPPLRPDGGR
ncbi:MAG: sigma-70 family RNA polymerase sigma factor, partial [Clostridia bacterium]|nr:sigma-70 family RNA polymerase sigma factor [Clostridia bacterium]